MNAPKITPVEGQPNEVIVELDDWRTHEWPPDAPVFFNHETQQFTPLPAGAGYVGVVVRRIAPEGPEDPTLLHVKLEALEKDWTAKGGCANSSDAFLRLVGAIAEILPSYGWSFRDRHAVAQVVLARLAHTWGLRPPQH